MGNFLSRISYIKVKVVKVVFASLEDYDKSLFQHKFNFKVLHFCGDRNTPSITVKVYNSIPNKYIHSLFLYGKQMSITHEFMYQLNSDIMPNIFIPSNRSDTHETIRTSCKFVLRHLPTSEILSDMYGTELRFFNKTHILPILEHLNMDKYEYDLVYLPTNTSINIL